MKHEERDVLVLMSVLPSCRTRPPCPHQTQFLQTTKVVKRKFIVIQLNQSVNTSIDQYFKHFIQIFQNIFHRIPVKPV